MNVSTRLVILLCLLPLLSLAKETRYGGYVLADKSGDESVAAQLNLALLRLFNNRQSSSDSKEAWVPLELRFDAGQLRKRDRSRAQKHFDQMLRRLAKSEYEEAHEQVFRAERFARRAFPYSMDFRLFSEILYYRSAVDQGLGKKKAARQSYCKYLYLMSNLSRSSVSIGQKIPDLKSCDAGDETGELVISSKVDGGIVYLDGMPVGVVGKKLPYAAPFLARGIHFVEVRKPGFARWGEVIEIKPGKSVKKRAKLKRPRSGVNQRELQPLEGLVLSGPDASDQAYLQDALFQYTQQVGVDVFLLGKLEAASRGKSRLHLLSFSGGELKRASVDFDPQEFEFEFVMLSALREVGLQVQSVANATPSQDAGYLFFKVK